MGKRTKKRLPKDGDIYEVAYAPALKIEVLKVRRTWVERRVGAAPEKVIWVAFQAHSRVTGLGAVQVLDLSRFRAEYCFVRSNLHG